MQISRRHSRRDLMCAGGGQLISDDSEFKFEYRCEYTSRRRVRLFVERDCGCADTTTRHLARPVGALSQSWSTRRRNLQSLGACLQCYKSFTSARLSCRFFLLILIIESSTPCSSCRVDVHALNNFHVGRCRACAKRNPATGYHTGPLDPEAIPHELFPLVLD